MGPIDGVVTEVWHLQTCARACCYYRCHAVGLLTKLCFVASDLDRIVEPLRATCTTKVKANSVKQEYEKQDELKRSALRAVAALLHIPDAGKVAAQTVVNWNSNQALNVLVCRVWALIGRNEYILQSNLPFWLSLKWPIPATCTSPIVNYSIISM